MKSTQGNMDEFLSMLPGCISKPLQEHELSNLIEVVLDVGRVPEARFFSGAIDLSNKTVTQELINLIVSKLSFGEDNRAGISGTLHRISVIRDRSGTPIGLTCRVGRAIYGTSDIIRDLLETGKSILMLGKPGYGKTTRLRDTARLLADEYKKRVIIVDTSNEIAGDGTVPHPAIGRARRMPVPSPARQAQTMIEAVENHTPEVVVIDEIGDFKDVQAARTIAERGVQLIGTAHGFTIGNIIDNPMLSDLIGGCQAVTLGDDEAKKRGTRKMVVERKHAPTFDIVVEIIDFDHVGVYLDAADAVDAYLAGELTGPNEIRSQTDSGVNIQTVSVPHERYSNFVPEEQDIKEKEPDEERTKFYTFGLNRSAVLSAFNELEIDGVIVNKPENADVILTASTKKRAAVKGAPSSAMVISVKSNTKRQIQTALLQLDSYTE